VTAVLLSVFRAQTAVADRRYRLLQRFLLGSQRLDQSIALMVFQTRQPFLLLPGEKARMRAGVITYFSRLPRKGVLPLFILSLLTSAATS